MRNGAIIALAVSLVGTAALAGAAEKASWIHIRVDEAGGGAKVNVNLPMTAVDVALDMVKDEALAKGKIRIDGEDMSLADMRRIWQQVRASGDAEFVTIEEKGETVRVSQKGGRVFVDVTKQAGDAVMEKVSIEIPSAAVDALLATEGESLDLRGALAVLAKEAPGATVQIQDGESTVRVWID